MAATPAPKRNRSVFLSPTGIAGAEADEDLSIAKAEELHMRGIPDEFFGCPLVYVIIVKIDGTEYLKIGKAHRFFSTKRKDTKKTNRQRYFSIIRDLRFKCQCKAKIVKILCFIKEYVGEDGELTINDIESDLLSKTTEHKIIPKEGLKEYRDLEKKEEIMEIINSYIRSHELTAHKNP